jgi:hypothetical protein
MITRASKNWDVDEGANDRNSVRKIEDRAVEEDTDEVDIADDYW